MNRDPRKDPRPGDVLKKGESTVMIHAVPGNGFAFSFEGFMKDAPPMPEWDVEYLPLYRKWAKDAEVIHVAEA